MQTHNDYNADLSRFVMKKIMTLHEEFIKQNFVAHLRLYRRFVEIRPGSEHASEDNVLITKCL